jgi:hypothetical protein
MGAKMNACRTLVGKPEAKKQLGRLRHKFEGNMKMDVREIEWGDVDCINWIKARDQWRAVLNSVMNHQVL